MTSKHSILSIIIFLLTLIPLTLLAQSTPPAQPTTPSPQPQQTTSAAPAADLTTSTDNPPEPASSAPLDPNSDPALAEIENILQSDPNQPSSYSFTKNTALTCHYHPQITPRIFALINYPYFPGGQDYPQSQPVSLAPSPSTDTPAPAAAPPATPPDPNGGSSTESLLTTPPPPNPEEIYLTVQQYFDLIYQWRRLNESPATTLEILRTVELTKTDTNIYRLDSAAAIDAKRTLGLIARTNHTFDQLSRFALQTTLDNHPQKPLKARLEKILSELQSLLDLLADQNDRIGIILGVGKIDRQNPAAFFAPLNYSASTLPHQD